MGTNNENTSWRESLIQISPKCFGSGRRNIQVYLAEHRGHWGRCNIGTGAGNMNKDSYLRKEKCNNVGSIGRCIKHENKGTFMAGE